MISCKAICYFILQFATYLPCPTALNHLLKVSGYIFFETSVTFLKDCSFLLKNDITHLINDYGRHEIKTSIILLEMVSDWNLDAQTMFRLKVGKFQKDFLVILNSSKKLTKKFDPTTMIPQVELFSFVFWKKWGYQKVLLKLTDL